VLRPNVKDLERELDPMGLRFGYTGIRVRDLTESIRFYVDVLGMEIVEPEQSTPPTRGRVATLRSPGSAQLLELNWYEPGSAFGLPYSNGQDLDHLAFECDDVDRAVSELESKGAKVLVRPREIGGAHGWQEAFVEDPNGIWIELIPSKGKPGAD
jgi:lactoylglutathione lyase